MAFFTRWRRLLKLRGLRPWCLVVLVALGPLGCSHVAPYQRARLAHPTMDPRDAESGAYDHLLSVQEGAIGGSEGIGVGCGCN